MKHFSSSAQEKESCGRKSVAGKSAITEQIGISRQNLYYQPRLLAKDLELKNKIEAVILEHKAYGYRRIAIALGINHKRVHRVMKLFGLKARRSLNRQPKVRSNLDLSSTNRHTQAPRDLPFRSRKRVSQQRFKRDFNRTKYPSFDERQKQSLAEWQARIFLPKV